MKATRLTDGLQFLWDLLDYIHQYEIRIFIDIMGRSIPLCILICAGKKLLQRGGNWTQMGREVQGYFYISHYFIGVSLFFFAFLLLYH